MHHKFLVVPLNGITVSLAKAQGLPVISPVESNVIPIHGLSEPTKEPFAKTKPFYDINQLSPSFRDTANNIQ